MKFWTDDRDDSTFKSEAYREAFPSSEELFGKEQEKPIAPLGKDDGHGFTCEKGDWRDESFWGRYEGR